MFRLLIALLLFVGVAQAQYSSQVVRLPHEGHSIEQVDGEYRFKTPSRLALASASSPVWGSVVNLGRFFVLLYVNGQPFRTQVDSGSSTLAIFADGCSTCGQHADNPFNASGLFMACGTDCSLSDGACTADKEGCSFKISYADSSGLQGRWAKATVSVGSADGISAVNTPVGAVDCVEAHFQCYALDGIVGVMYAAANCLPGCQPTLLDSLVNSQAIPGRQFAMCLTEEGGVMDWGGPVSSHYSSDIQWAAVNSRGYAYQIYVEGIAVVGTRALQMPTSGWPPTIVDSGTTLTAFPEDIYDSIVSAFIANGSVAKLSDTLSQGVFKAECVLMTAEDMATWPDISFMVDGYNGAPSFPVVLNHNKYLLILYEQGRDTREYCITVGMMRVPQTVQNILILGDTFMESYYTVFDQDNNRVGFAEPRCPTQQDCPPADGKGPDWCTSGNPASAGPCVEQPLECPDDTAPGSNKFPIVIVVVAIGVVLIAIAVVVIIIRRLRGGDTPEYAHGSQEYYVPVQAPPMQHTQVLLPQQGYSDVYVPAE